ncbi:MAG TPA: hypothetical protein VEZ90_01430 [Blastocatellia bacterium]|nr:hypothetical protein [Blastocatellia bacterium]
MVLARKLGRLETSENRVFDDEDIARTANAYHAWSQDGAAEEKYADLPALPRSQTGEIKQHDYVLPPGRYVGAEAAEEDDDEAFTEKMQRLTSELAGQFAEASRLEGEKKKNLARLGYELTEG